MAVLLGLQRPRSHPFKGNVLVAQLSVAGKAVAYNMQLPVEALVVPGKQRSQTQQQQQPSQGQQQQQPQTQREQQQQQQEPDKVIFVVDHAVFYSGIDRRVYPGKVRWALHEDGTLHLDVTPWCKEDITLRRQVQVRAQGSPAEKTKELGAWL